MTKGPSRSSSRRARNACASTSGIRADPPCHIRGLAENLCSALQPSLRVIKPCESIDLLRTAAQSAAGVLQSLVESVHLVAEIAESDLFGSQLLPSIYFSRLQLLFLVF